MKNILSVSLLCLIPLVRSDEDAKEAKYPRFERSCFRSMPSAELNECLKFNLQQNLPRFRAGIPGMMNESIDPLHWKEFNGDFKTSVLRGSMSIRGINFSGWSKLRILDVRANVADPKKLITEVDWWAPSIVGVGRFDMSGKIGRYEFVGAGPFEVALGGVSGTWTIRGSQEKTAPYMEILSLRGLPEIDTFKVTAENAAIGNERIGQLVVATINRTWRIMVGLANKPAEKQWEDFWTERLNRIFLNVPYEELFPLRPEPEEQLLDQSTASPPGSP
ncbi:unnamed protein product [Bemisia tabaci]|uniref:Uncharacterized protein n=1 Tax=Bemisia tabaci TaxID=7038 RepID=A0A9P0A7J6_BEMTA|nr:unnamed protein product [Bemisia tabaci]